jgi:sn1-specific diacylglycerol lipase
MWADPATCLTIPSSGLPAGRRVSAYCIAPPSVTPCSYDSGLLISRSRCLTSAALSELSNKLITSFVYSYDVVSRLSLGSIRDLTRACWWLCDGKDDENPNHIIRKALGIQGGLALLKGRHRTADDATFVGCSYCRYSVSNSALFSSCPFAKHLKPT